MNDASTKEGRRAIMEDLLKKHGQGLEYLYDRWQDEKEYEDWADYAAQMKKMFGNMFVKATQRPFGVVIKIDGRLRQAKITVNSRSISWTA